MKGVTLTLLFLLASLAGIGYSHGTYLGLHVAYECAAYWYCRPYKRSDVVYYETHVYNGVVHTHIRVDPGDCDCV